MATGIETALYSVVMDDGRTLYNLTEDEVLPLMDGDTQSHWVSIFPQSRFKDFDGK
jgi:hypothetical protein